MSKRNTKEPADSPLDAITAFVSNEPKRQVTRGEVADLLIDVLGIEPAAEGSQGDGRTLGSNS